MWVEKQEANSSLCITIQTRFSAVEKPMLHTSQLMLPLQAQQLGRSYNGRLLVHLEIVVKQTVAAGETPRSVCVLPSAGQVVQQFSADIHDMCVGEVPVLVGSCLCHRPPGALSCYFIVFLGTAVACHPCMTLFVWCLLIPPPPSFFFAPVHPTRCPVSSGQCKVIVSQERLCTGFADGANRRLVNNHPLVSACLLQSRQMQYSCEVRSVPIFGKC